MADLEFARPAHSTLVRVVRVVRSRAEGLARRHIVKGGMAVQNCAQAGTDALRRN
jgi:hypothetical protein